MKGPPAHADGSLLRIRPASPLGHGAYVRRLGPLGALRHIELDLLVLLQVPVSGALDRAEVHEDVGAVLLGDEAVALLRAEPLHRAGGHVPFPPFRAVPGLAVGPPVRQSGPLGRSREGTARSDTPRC